MHLDSSLSLTERVDQLAHNLKRGRYLVVFDNLESQMAPAEAEGDDRRPRAFADPEWAEFFAAVFRHDWHVTWLFTSRHRLDLLDGLGETRLMEHHLPGLSRRQAVMFMGNLPRLAREPLADKVAAYDHVGGHPKTIELLEGWLASAPAAAGGPSRLRALLDDPATAGRLAEEWETYFLGALLDRLTDDERGALEAVSVFGEDFWWGMVAWMMEPEGTCARMSDLEPHKEAAVEVLSRWHELSLVQFENPGTKAPWYSLHPVVREYVWGQVAEADRERLHLRAAAWSREQILGPYRGKARVQLTPENENEAATQLLDRLAAQTENMNRARWAVETGLSWRRHLFAARRWEEAASIVNTVCDLLVRWGQRDLAKSLLRQSVATLDGWSKAIAQCNLATLLRKEGRLNDALAGYQAAMPILGRLGGRKQTADVLSHVSSVYREKGDYEQAIEKEQASLETKREIGDERGQAISLHELSVLHMFQGQDERSLARSREAESIFRRLGIEALVAPTLHQQGLILNSIGKPAEALERFQRSLSIARRIGDEEGMAHSLGEIGKLLWRGAHRRQAIAMFTECIALYRRLNDPAQMAIMLGILGVVHEEQGEFAAALKQFEQASRLCAQFCPRQLPVAQVAIARVKAKMEASG